jgi:hypothetical protein
MLHRAAVALSLVFFTGCLASHFDARIDVAQQAAADFRCSVEDVSVETVHAWHARFFGANGCGRSGLYLVGQYGAYAAGPTSPSLPRPPTVADADEWHPGGGISDPGPADPRLRCASPSVRACAAERFVCPAETFALADLGGGRWETHGCGQRAVWMPTARGWALDQ